ncbi:hypothetical protein IAI10_08995 [Clostridium sp. 19966]|uniref:hypothetical protein n=1 Tax=Clostridium sp. 19966 TaxID=2768166 RepID=UPI0028DE3929|nr:hypothetical protein [Clostridium sp. 19966]MDT8716793.1 hypothetical protein [Clostridium sp. 19966]
MKQLILDTIIKFFKHTKYFALQSRNSFKFQGNKNEVIKVMLDSLIESKVQEKASLLSELKSIKQQSSTLENDLNNLKEENQIYIKKFNGLKAFQDFLINNMPR